jgi:Ser/Thr protein kinase RdoA (MazF antagonist)
VYKNNTHLNFKRERERKNMTEDFFPVVYSTLACEALVSRLLPHYDIGMVANCQFWNRGLSDVYLVETDAEKYILRISHLLWRDKSDIDFELELLYFLKQRHIPVAYPLLTKEGKLSVEINAPEGKRYAALFTYAPGNIPVGDLNITQSRKLGEILATLHNESIDFQCPYPRKELNPEYLLDESFQKIATLFEHRNQDLSFLKEVITNIKLQLQDFPKEPPYWVTCWGDPHSGNTHFTPENHVTLFDFDQCGYGWRAFDLGKFLQLGLTVGMSKNVREAFIIGYQSVQELSDIELKSLRVFTQMAQIWMWAISLNYASIHHNSRLDDRYFKMRLEELKRFKSPDCHLY